MKKIVKLLRWYQYLILFLGISFAFLLLRNLGLPLDAFKSGEKVDVLLDDVYLEGGEFIDGTYVISSAYHPIIIEGAQYRTVVFDIERINISDKDAYCTIYFAGKDNDFTDRYHKTFKIREGVNKLTVPYRKAYSKIRIDFSGVEGDSYEFNSFVVYEKYARLGTDLIDILIIYIIVLLLIYGILIIKKKIKPVIAFSDKIDGVIFAPIKKIGNEICRYSVEHKGTIIILLITAFLTFGSQMFNYTLSIDEENSTINPNEYVYVVACGRYTFGMLLKLFGNAPYFNTIMASVFMFCASILLLMVLDKVCKKKATLLSEIVCGGLFMSMPYVIGQSLNFSTFGIWIAFGYVLSELAILCLLYANEEQGLKKGSFYVYAAIVTTAVFGIYQAFIVTFVFMIFILTFIMLLSASEKNDIKIIIKFIAKTVVFFIVCIIFYEIINKLCVKFISPESGYLESTFVGWNKTEPNDWVLYNVWENWSKLLNGTYFNLTAGTIVKWTVVGFLIYAFVTVVAANKVNRWFLMIMSPLMLIVPFAIPLALGTFVMLGRSLEPFPILLGVVWYLILNGIDSLKCLYKVVSAFAVLLLVMQVRSYNNFVYADQIRYELDINMANEIMKEVQQIEGYREKGLCFVGVYNFDNRYSLSHISGFESFFNFNGGDNTRIINFLNLSGYSVCYPTEDQKNLAKDVAASMPVWPNSGSVIDMGDYIVINIAN